MYWLVVMIAFLILLVLCQFSLAWLKQRDVHVNRWIWGVAAFLIVIVPHLIWHQIPTVIDTGLYLLCAVFAVNFMIEQHSYIQAFNEKHS
ncbi:diacylglycerol kinase [Lacticaseibacillus saniviri]